MSQPQSDAQALYALQQIELEIIWRQKRLQAITAELEDEAALAQARQAQLAAEQAVATPRSEVRDLELEIQTNAEKMKTAEEQLYAGTEQNPKVLQELQQEGEALKRRAEQLDERLLAAMEALDSAQAALDAANDALEQAAESHQTAQNVLLDEQAQLQEDVTALKAQRQDALKPISDDLYAIYKTLRSKKANQAVAPLNGYSCGICGIEQTVANAQRVQHSGSSDLVYCENCGRILVRVP